MYYTTKDGATFTKWWHPLGYAILYALFWPLKYMQPKFAGSPGLGILLTIGGCMISATIVGLLTALIIGVCHLCGKI